MHVIRHLSRDLPERGRQVQIHDLMEAVDGKPPVRRRSKVFPAAARNLHDCREDNITERRRRADHDLMAHVSPIPASPIRAFSRDSIDLPISTRLCNAWIDACWVRSRALA